MAKSTTKKEPAPKAAKSAEKDPGGAKTQTAKGTGIHAPVTPSKELGEVVGHDSMPRSQVISKVWEYIKAHNLQNPENKREIVADENLKKVFGKDRATMFEMNKYISAHLKAA